MLTRHKKSYLRSSAAPENASATEERFGSPEDAARKAVPSGVWGLTADLITVSGKMRTIGETIQLMDSLSRDLKGLRTPLVNTLKELSKRGDDLASQADTSDQTFSSRFPGPTSYGTRLR